MRGEGATRSGVNPFSARSARGEGAANRGAGATFLGVSPLPANGASAAWARCFPAWPGARIGLGNGGVADEGGFALAAIGESEERGRFGRKGLSVREAVFCSPFSRDMMYQRGIVAIRLCRDLKKIQDELKPRKHTLRPNPDTSTRASADRFTPDGYIVCSGSGAEEGQ